MSGFKFKRDIERPYRRQRRTDRPSRAASDYRSIYAGTVREVGPEWLAHCDRIALEVQRQRAKEQGR
jgi:hypothetical protein